jgi:hypothetical protein
MFSGHCSSDWSDPSRQELNNVQIQLLLSPFSSISAQLSNHGLVILLRRRSAFRNRPVKQRDNIQRNERSREREKKGEQKGT